MIVVDSSALLAVLQGEADAERCVEVLSSHDELLMAAPTLTEAIIVASARELDQEMQDLIGSLGIMVVPLTRGRALAAAEDYRRWGKGFHPANLNFGDCFAYALARERNCPLLFVGEDFARTDIRAAHA